MGDYTTHSSWNHVLNDVTIQITREDGVKTVASLESQRMIIPKGTCGTATWLVGGLSQISVFHRTWGDYFLGFNYQTMILASTVPGYDMNDV